MSPLILVAGDETNLRDSIAISLERHGYETTVARSGQEAVRMAQEAAPDVAVLDIRLPDMNGLEALRRIREIAPGTEVIMVAADTSASRGDALRGGAFTYLAGPLDLEELRVVVDKAVAHLLMRRELSHHRGLSPAREKALVAIDPGGGVQVDFSSGGIVLDAVERQLILEALQAAGWNRTRAARLLGITKETLRYRIEKFHLRPPA